MEDVEITQALLVDHIITSILFIQQNRKLLRQIQSEIKPVLFGQITSQWDVWDKVQIIDESLRRSYYDVGKALADATRYWTREELAAVIGLLEE